MSNAALETAIEAAWDARDTITPATTGETREAIEDTLAALDTGALRVAERRENGDWHVNEKGGFTILPLKRHGTNQRRQRWVNMVGQGSVKI